MVHWDTSSLMYILQCILGFHSQNIDFTNAFSQAYIPSEEAVLIKLTSYFKSDGGQHDVVLRLKKILYGRSKATHLWYEN